MNMMENMIDNYNKVLAIISVIEDMKDTNMMLTAVCMSIDSISYKTGMPVSDILESINHAVIDVNKECGPVTEKMGDTVKIMFKEKEND